MVLYYCDFSLARLARKSKGLSREDIARNSAKSGDYICAGTVRRIEQGLPARPESIRALARQLDLDPALLRGPAQHEVDDRGPDPEWVQLPAGMTLDRARLRRAIFLDMDGKHAAAAGLMHDLLELVPTGRDTWKIRVYALTQLASFQTNMGHNDVALETLASIVEEPHGKGRESSPLLRRADYVRGIALRRMGQYAEAHERFQELINSQDIELPALHQLGVANLVQGIALDDAALLSDAEVLLDECLDRLGRETGQAGYRAALAMRRMGQLRDHQGKTAEAIHCYLEAFGIFASHRATRYVKATRAELNRLLFPWGP